MMAETAESLHIDQQTAGREGGRKEMRNKYKERMGMVEFFFEILPFLAHLQHGHTSQYSPNNSINWRPCIHIYEFISAILIQATAVTLQGLGDMTYCEDATHLNPVTWRTPVAWYHSPGSSTPP